ncbi:MAG: hypothetical protein JW929_11265 [Anaerolineales bacterium]|nr:hypothetical protein [Anaerolineales bacterium]
MRFYLREIRTGGAIFLRALLEASAVLEVALHGSCRLIPPPPGTFLYGFHPSFLADWM